MLQRRSVHASLLAALLLATWFVAIIGRPGGSAPTPRTGFTLAALRGMVELAPARWLGRTVVVRALAVPCPWWGTAARFQRCAGQPVVLMGTAVDAPTTPLPLVRAAPSALVSIMHDVPIIRDILPRTEEVPIFRQARFRVQLRAVPGRSYAAYIEAVLVQVAPLVEQASAGERGRRQHIRRLREQRGLIARGRRRYPRPGPA
jgi:hypothetical protein